MERLEPAVVVGQLRCAESWSSCRSNELFFLGAELSTAGRIRVEDLAGASLLPR